MTWFDTGNTAIEQEKKRRAETRKQPFRFFVKPGEENKRSVIFLDDWKAMRTIKRNGQEIKVPATPFSFQEYQVEIDGNWNNYVTYFPGYPDGCPLKKNGFKPYFVSMFTVITTIPADKNEDGVDKTVKLLFPAKITSASYIQSLIQEDDRLDGNLQYWQCTISRSKSDDPTTGNVIIPKKKLTLDEINLMLPEGEDAKPFDYTDVLKPMEYNVLMDLFQTGRLQMNKFDAMRMKKTRGGNKFPQYDMEEPPF